MRSILQQRQHERAAASSANGNQEVTAGAGAAATDTLFFGCRYEAKDFHYGDEWRAAAASGALTLLTAFSRDKPRPNGGKWYVQHRIAEAGAAVAEAILVRGARVYVSGSAQSMPADVRAAIRGVLVEHGGMVEAEAERYVKGMEREGRYAVEAWS